uniref:Saposin B-type domain-containing protein n=1 Tax=Parastrongyloides trichosuri TaxID=131310 RepID=A0A0N4ZSF2_PARTI
MCIEVIDNILSNLGDGEGELLEDAYKECDIITNYNILLDPMCKTIVTRELNDIVEELKNNRTPKEVCQEIGFCNIYLI